MDHLEKHSIPADIAARHLNQCLLDVNILCSHILEIIDFQQGEFYTLLPSRSKLDQLYDFNRGGIVPQISKGVAYSNTSQTSFSKIPSIDDEVATVLFNNINNMGKCCIFDDVTRNFDSPIFKGTENCFRMNYRNQLYYYLDQDNMSVELISQCLKASNAIWHMLGIISRFQYEGNHEIKEDAIQAICSNISMILISAYDGEGYIFWERTSWPRSGTGIRSKQSLKTEHRRPKGHPCPHMHNWDDNPTGGTP